MQPLCCPNCHKIMHTVWIWFQKQQQFVGELFFSLCHCGRYFYKHDFLLLFVVYTLLHVPCRKREAFHGSSSSTSSDSSDSGTETSDEQRFNRRKAKSMAKARSRCVHERFIFLWETCVIFMVRIQILVCVLTSNIFDQLHKIAT